MHPKNLKPSQLEGIFAWLAKQDGPTCYRLPTSNAEHVYAPQLQSMSDVIEIMTFERHELRRAHRRPSPTHAGLAEVTVERLAYAEHKETGHRIYDVWRHDGAHTDWSKPL